MDELLNIKVVRSHYGPDLHSLLDLLRPHHPLLCSAPQETTFPRVLTKQLPDRDGMIRRRWKTRGQIRKVRVFLSLRQAVALPFPRLYFAQSLSGPSSQQGDPTIVLDSAAGPSFWFRKPHPSRCPHSPRSA